MLAPQTVKLSIFALPISCYLAYRDIYPLVCGFFFIAIIFHYSVECTGNYIFIFIISVLETLMGRGTCDLDRYPCSV